MAWIEGPWLQKHNGTYYLEYSASGTQWKTYAEGYYTAKSPMGPFTYAPNNPLLRKTDGLVTGTGHGSIVEGPDGQPLAVLHHRAEQSAGRTAHRHGPGGVRQGRQHVLRITDTPQWAPGVVADPAKDGDSGSIPVTINKLRAMNALSRFPRSNPVTTPPMRLKFQRHVVGASPTTRSPH